MMRYRSIFSILPAAFLLMGLLIAPARAQTSGLFAHVQLIHTVPDAGPVDIYVDDAKVRDDLAFQTATPFMPVLCPNKCKRQVDIVAGDETDNSNPLFTADVILQADVYYGAYALGVLAQGVFDVLLLDNLRTTARAPGKVEYLFINGVPGSRRGTHVDVRLLDPDDTSIIKELLVNNWGFGDYVGYWRLEPGMNYFEITTADNSETLRRDGIDLSDYEGQTITLLGSPFVNGGGMLIAFDAEGNRIEVEQVMALPRTVEATAMQTLAVEGNYPNPFNPSTSIRFDLTDPAQVSLEVIDMLGRIVMTVPAQRFEAGADHAFQVDASSLASGTYLYRITAQTEARTLVTQTGRMILSK